ncbi:STAS domain-containing protein [Streptomyces sp. NPDC059063]|uniref:STAS domain-containing protein n=1 Tax=unclassified Streptomyces TaxID=2593676 RepID=UPI0036B01F6C
MALSWHCVERNGVTILAVCGRLCVEDTVRFTEALASALSRTARPVLLDLGGLHTWHPERAAAVLAAARTVTHQARPLAVCGTGHLLRHGPGGDRLGPARVYADRASALTALADHSP